MDCRPTSPSFRSSRRHTKGTGRDEWRSRDRPACRHRKGPELAVAFDRKTQPRPDRTVRRLFFFTPLERNNHRVGIAKDSMHGGQRLKPGKAVNVAKSSYFRHGSIV